MGIETAKTVVAAFGAACGMPFFTLDDGMSVAARLANGLRFELEYMEEPDAFLLHVVLGAATDFSHKDLLRRSAGLIAGCGIGIGIVPVAGEACAVAMTRIPVTDVRALMDTANRLVGIPENIGSVAHSVAAQAVAEPAPFATPGWMSV